VGLATFTFTGAAGMKSKLVVAGKGIDRDMRIANRDEADAVVSLVNNELIPVLTGGHRDSAKVVGTGSNGVQSVMTISYSGPAILPLHEFPLFKPPTWGASINFTKPGTGHKFLEKGLRQRSAGMLERIAARVRF